MSETIADQVASNVRAELARRRKPQHSLAAPLGLTHPAVSRRLNGHVPFDVTELQAVADFLGIPLAQLIAEPTTAAAAS